jgi:hypothetical protein
MTDPTNPPAGWYDDGRGALRYWDGTQWTEHTAPLAPAADQGATAAYPATPDDLTATAPYGSVPPADQSATQQYGTQQYGAQPYGTAPYGSTGYGTAGYGTATVPGGPQAPAPAPEPAGPNVLGIVALVVAAVGFVFACIPFVQVVGWILLPIAFVLSIVALFLKGRKWPAIVALIVSIVGAIVGAIVAAVVAFGIFGQLVDSGVIEDEIREGIEEEFGTPVPTESAPPEDDGSGSFAGLAFGETMEWSDGVTMTVSEAEPFTPSNLAGGADQAENIVFTLTLTNGSDESVQPVVISTLSSDGTEATRIIDIGAEGGQVGIPPTTALQPGESVTWREAWSVADPDSLTMETAPSFVYESVTFTNVQ